MACRLTWSLSSTALLPGAPTGATLATPPCPIQFPIQNALPVGTNSVALVTADFNGDSLPDLAVANRGSSSLSILMNQGNRRFGVPIPVSVGYAPTALATADFNGDGLPDLAVADVGPSSGLWLLFGRGDGSFRPAVGFGTRVSIDSIAVGDFNGDNRPDITVGGGLGEVYVRLNDGQGGFAAELVLGGMQRSSAVAIADFDGDGHPDLAGTDLWGGKLMIWAGKGDGTFEQPRSLSVVPSPKSIVTGDVNGDGRLDLIIGGIGSTNLSLLTGRPGGGFSEGKSIAAGSYPLAISLADLNGDRRPDLIFGLDRESGVRTLLGNGDGAFQEIDTYSAGAVPLGVVSADFDGDDIADLALVSDSMPGGSGRVHVLWGKGGGRMQAPQSRVTFASSFTTPGLAVDIDRDGKADLIETDNGGHVLVRLGLGDGSFEPGVDTATGYILNGQVTAADLDRDGFLELSVPISTFPNFPFPMQHEILILGSKSRGLFSARSAVFLSNFGSSVETGEFNGDGRGDLCVVYSQSRKVGVSLASTNGGMNFIVDLDVGGYAQKALADQFVGGTAIDLIVSHHLGISILEGNGDGTFQAARELTNLVCSDLAVADLNGDGRSDILGVSGQDILVWLNSGPAGWEGPSRYPVAQNSFVVRAGDLDGDGRLDVVTANPEGISVLPGLGNGSLGPYAFVPAGGFVTGLSLADIDADNRLDVVLSAGVYLRNWVLMRNSCAEEVRPSLAIERQDRFLVLTWTEHSSAVVLEATESLSPPLWKPVVVPQETKRMEIPLEDLRRTRFFRLKSGP